MLRTEVILSFSLPSVQEHAPRHVPFIRAIWSYIFPVWMAGFLEMLVVIPAALAWEAVRHCWQSGTVGRQSGDRRYYSLRLLFVVAAVADAVF
jgi:hypothetical protein